MTEYLSKLLDKSRELLNWSKWTYLKAPGFGVPALPIGYPGWLTAASSYTTVYNTLNFPVASMKVKFSKLLNRYGWPLWSLIKNNEQHLKNYQQHHQNFDSYIQSILRIENHLNLSIFSSSKNITLGTEVLFLYLFLLFNCFFQFVKII